MAAGRHKEGMVDRVRLPKPCTALLSPSTACCTVRNPAGVWVWCCNDISQRYNLWKIFKGSNERANC